MYKNGEKMMQQPSVSVIIPSYKNVGLLKKAIDSVLSQSYKPIEIIVVDDNIPDSTYRKETSDLMSSYTQHQNIQYIQNEKNSERSYSRNNGIRHSSGDFIAFLDNDDEILPNKIQNQVERLQELGEEYVVCYSRYIRKRNGRIVCIGEETREGNLKFEILSRDLPIHPGSNLLIRRDALILTGGFDEKMSYNEDIDLLLKLLDVGKIACDKEIGLVVNLHGKGPNFDFDKISKQFLEKENSHINLLNSKNQKKLKTIICLQLVKYYFARKPFKALYKIVEFNINPIVLMKYFCYLAFRAISKKSYGFTLKYHI